MENFLPNNRQIVAIVPVYTKNGDESMVLTCNGQTLSLSLKAATIVRRLANRHTIDLCSLKNKTAKITRSTIWQPLVLAPDLVLVPVKIRKPKISGDTTGGYINFTAIQKIESAEIGSVLSLAGNHHVQTLWKRTTLYEHLQKAHLASLTLTPQTITMQQFFNYLGHMAAELSPAQL